MINIVRIIIHGDESRGSATTTTTRGWSRWWWRQSPIKRAVQSKRSAGRGRECACWFVCVRWKRESRRRSFVRSRRRRSRWRCARLWRTDRRTDRRLARGEPTNEQTTQIFSIGVKNCTHTHTHTHTQLSHCQSAFSSERQYGDLCVQAYVWVCVMFCRIFSLCVRLFVRLPERADERNVRS